jgi:hypothetical protein
VEAALWSAIRALHERSDLLERLGDRCDIRGQRRSARSFRTKARDAREQAELVRVALNGAATTSLQSLSEDDEQAEAAQQA